MERSQRSARWDIGHASITSTLLVRHLEASRYVGQARLGRSARPGGWRRGSYCVSLGPLVFRINPQREQFTNPCRPASTPAPRTPSALPRARPPSRGAVAPNDRASACRTGLRLSAMILSAPRRRAAMTAHRPTAPSPTIATTPDAGAHRGVMPCAHDVGERQQRTQRRGGGR
jgi:hypothetical protein